MQSNTNAKANNVLKKSVKSGSKSNVKNIKLETSNEIIQAQKCLEVAQLLMQADQMVKKRICRKILNARK